MNFQVISQAGLTQAQFAALVDVTRVTVNTWVQGHYRPRPQMRARVHRALQLISEAVDNGKLPINEAIQEELLQKQLERIASKLARGG
jgi:transcriptional regulator with XRE-family HTH domain